MKQHLTSLKTFFRKSADKAGTNLPPKIIEHLVERNFSALRRWIEDQLKSDPNGPETISLIETARQLELSVRDIEKLEIFRRYFGGNLSEAYRRATTFAYGDQFDPDMATIAVYSLFFMKQFDRAYQVLESVQATDPTLFDHPDHVLMAALICQAANRPAEMKVYIDSACRQLPDDPDVAANAYAIYFELGETEVWGRIRESFHQGDYSIARICFQMGFVELALGNYPEGFRLLEMRYGLPQARYHINPSLFDRTRWQGEPIVGKTLLVSAEQGLGDTIQMARYLTMLQNLGARCIVMETQLPTLSLLKYNFPDICFVEGRHGFPPMVEFDLWVGSLSLPHLFGTIASNVPGRFAYLRPPTENAVYWKGRIRELSGKGRPRIGIAWAGQPTHASDRRRSIPFPCMMESIRTIDADFFALQTQVPAPCPGNLLNISEELLTLADTAALIDEMDWVITVDTSVAHLSGALGKETWLLLPYRYEWRWGLEDEENAWYDAVRVLRQKKCGDWDSLLEEIFQRRLPERMRLQGEA